MKYLHAATYKTPELFLFFFFFFFFFEIAKFVAFAKNEIR